MQRWIVAALILIMACSLFLGCEKKDTYEIALITDMGNIDDKAFNQGAWEGITAYAASSGKTYSYYRPYENTDSARLETIGGAVRAGAKVIVCPGSMFGSVGEAVQKEYPKVSFLLLDVSVNDMTPASNTALITYREEQSGYFAGYAAVKDGYRKLGFMGGVAVPAVVRFGYGYLEGANDAAKELGVADAVEVKYWYSDSFTMSDSIRDRMKTWYASGTEIVFACGGSIYLSAVAAAEETGGRVIGVDRDMSAESELIVTSAIKSLEPSVEKALAAFYDNGGAWPAEYAGVETKLGAAEDSVGIPTAEAAWRFQTFTVAEYEALYQKVHTGEIAISDAVDAAPEVDINVDWQE